MSPEDERLVAGLVVLRDQLAPVVDEITFGWLSAEDRVELARALRTVADDLDPPAIVSGETVEGGADHDPSHRTQVDLPQRALEPEH